jgi:hypothetical protein
MYVCMYVSTMFVRCGWRRKYNINTTAAAVRLTLVVRGGGGGALYAGFVVLTNENENGGWELTVKNKNCTNSRSLRLADFWGGGWRAGSPTW